MPPNRRCYVFISCRHFSIIISHLSLQTNTKPIWISSFKKPFVCAVILKLWDTCSDVLFLFELMIKAINCKSNHHWASVLIFCLLEYLACQIQNFITCIEVILPKWQSDYFYGLVINLSIWHNYYFTGTSIFSKTLITCYNDRMEFFFLLNRDFFNGFSLTQI